MVPVELKTLFRFEAEVGRALEQVVIKASLADRDLSANQLFRLFRDELRTSCRHRRPTISRFAPKFRVREPDLSALPEDVQQLMRNPPNGDFYAALEQVMQHPCWSSTETSSR